MATDSSTAAVADGDVPQALAFVRAAFTGWRHQGWIRGEELADLEAYYDGLQGDAAAGKPLSARLTLPAPDVCWSCKGPVGAADYCPDCGAPANNDAVARLRRLVCLCHEVKRHEREHRIDLSAAHACLADANGRLIALRRKLGDQRLPNTLPTVLPATGAPPAAAAGPPAAAAGPPLPARNFFEVLLDPRSIQWLLASGGAVLAVGLVVWLAAAGLFENKLFVAVLLGGANLVVLLAGLAAVRFTRYQLAGRALALLACLVMPLNLWFYDYQDILKIEHDGHLWVAALVCVLLYAASALILRDPALVYVFVGGVALTGLLLLADHAVMSGALFWTASGPITFLAVLGLLCVHLVHVFPEGDGPFGQRKFGLAFFWSGHVTLALALLLLLAVQLTYGLFYESTFRPLFQQLEWRIGYTPLSDQSELVKDVWGQILALGIVAAACYTYLFSDLGVRKIGVYIHLGAITFLWAEVLLLNLAFTQWPNLSMPDRVEIVIVALAATGLLANVVSTRVGAMAGLLRRTGPPAALTMALLPLLLGLVLHVEAVWHRITLTWWYVAAMAASAVACRAAALLHREGRPWMITLYLFGGGGALMLAASGVELTLDPNLFWPQIAPWLMLIPVGFIVAGHFYRGRALETPVVWAAHAMVLVLIVSSLGSAWEGFTTHQGADNVWLTAFFAAAAVFYLLAAVWRDREFAVYACTASAAAAVWQYMTYYYLDAEYYVGAFALLGLGLLVLYRFAVLEKKPVAGLGRAAFQSANALIVVAEAAGALLALSGLAGRTFQLGLLVGLQAVLVVVALAALVLVRQAGWRRGYAVAAVGNAVLAVLVLILQIEWTVWEKLEIVCLALGVLVLAAAHLGWFRERESEDDLVGFGLLFGSVLTAVPLTCAVLYCRFSGADFDAFHTLNEVGALAAGLLLLASGVLTRVRSTTLTGAAVMAVYLLTLVAFVRLPAMLQTTAVYLMVGGGLFFLVGLLLAIYRDRLLALPQRFKRREGVFRMLNWR